MVEFAIVTPLLFALIFGVVDFGRALFAFNNLQDTARRAARLAAVQFPNPCAGTNAALVRDSASAWVRGFGGSATAPTVQVTCPTPGIVRVTISNYVFDPILPVPVLEGLTMSQQAGVRRENADPTLGL